MSTITQQRLEELFAAYNKLKVQYGEIDRKYSTEYHEPTLDMPPSLNLVPLTHTPKTPQQLTQESVEQVAPWYLSALANVTRAQGIALANIDRQIENRNEAFRIQSVKMLSTFRQNSYKLHVRLVNNGLLYSSANEKLNKNLLVDYETDLASAEKDTNNALDILKGERLAKEEIYNERIAALEDERAAREQNAYDLLAQKDAKLAEEVQKYNNNLQEKEQKYLASVARITEYARQAENDRALAAAKLYAELGASGLAEAVQKEKLNLAKSTFNTWRRHEATAIMQSDSFLPTHLGDYYYNQLVEWVNSALLA